jgi:hypothetical protein
MMKGDNLTEQIPRRTQPDDDRQAKHQGIVRVAGEAQNRHSADRSIAPSTAAQPSLDVFSHAGEYDVAEQQRWDYDEGAMRSLQLPFEGFLAVSSGFGDQVCVVPAWRVDEGVVVSLAA